MLEIPNLVVTEAHCRKIVLDIVAVFGKPLQAPSDLEALVAEALVINGLITEEAVRDTYAERYRDRLAGRLMLPDGLRPAEVASGLAQVPDDVMDGLVALKLSKNI